MADPSRPPASVFRTVRSQWLPGLCPLQGDRIFLSLWLLPLPPPQPGCSLNTDTGPYIHPMSTRVAHPGLSAGSRLDMPVRHSDGPTGRPPLGECEDRFREVRALACSHTAESREWSLTPRTRRRGSHTPHRPEVWAAPSPTSPSL